MSKERLEEIEKLAVMIMTTECEEIYESAVNVFILNNMKWLIKHAKEQTGRVQELENTLRNWMDRSDYLSGEYLEFKDKNKYYRGVLGFYADKENYKEFNDIMRARKVTMILEDNGIKALEALEESE